MNAGTLARYMLQLQEQGDLTWDSKVRINVDGKEYNLMDYMGHQMPTDKVEDWYYLLKAEIPSGDKVILTSVHYSCMKHAIGMDNKEPEGSVYEAYRNGSVYDALNSVWEELVRGGYANRYYRPNCIVYSLTRRGMQAVSDKTGLLIRYEMEFEPNGK